MSPARLQASSPVGPAAEAAVRLLTTARRVLVTGFGGMTVDGVVAACDLAELVGAAVDAGDPEAARPAGPTIARIGEVTADPEELRDRADLVVFWFCDPDAARPGFIERFVSPPAATPRPRRTLAVGPAAVLPVGPRHGHLPLEVAAAVDAARCVQLLVSQPEAAPADPTLAAAVEPLRQAIATADCVGFVTDDGADRVGLGPWSLVHLVRAVAHRTPAFEVSVRPRATTFAQTCTWRYGAAGAIARADRSGGEFLPAEAAAVPLIERGEVDGVLVVGGLAPAVERALAARRDGPTIVRLEGDGSRLVADLRAIRAAIAAEADGGRHGG